MAEQPPPTTPSTTPPTPQPTTPSSMLTLRPGQGCALFGVFFAAWAVWVLPYVFGPLGMVMGGLAYARGERRGRWVVLIAAAGMLAGILFGLLPHKFTEN